MGRTRKRRISLSGATAALVIALSLALASCSGGSLKVEDLLLGHGDFSAGAVTESNPLSTVTPLGVSAAQVELSGPDFTMTQSIVMFQSNESALSVIAGIKQDQLAQIVLPADTSKFEDASDILKETRDGQDYFTQFFVHELALVKVTISGPKALELLPAYAEKARKKVSRQ